MIRPEITGKKPGLSAKCNSDLPSLKDDDRRRRAWRSPFWNFAQRSAFPMTFTTS